MGWVCMRWVLWGGCVCGGYYRVGVMGWVLLGGYYRVIVIGYWCMG